MTEGRVMAALASEAGPSQATANTTAGKGKFRWQFGGGGEGPGELDPLV